MRNGKHRILLVDDEESIVKVIEKRLQSDGFEVIVAVNGEEAITKAREEQPDLIILDIMLPEISGFEVCAKLKAQQSTARIPVLIFTGKGYQGDERIFEDLGADAYLPKTVDETVLLHTIRKLLARTSQK